MGVFVHQNVIPLMWRSVPPGISTPPPSPTFPPLLKPESDGVAGDATLRRCLATLNGISGLDSAVAALGVVFPLPPLRRPAGPARSESVSEITLGLLCSCIHVSIVKHTLCETLLLQARTHARTPPSPQTTFFRTFAPRPTATLRREEGHRAVPRSAPRRHPTPPALVSRALG